MEDAAGDVLWGLADHQGTVRDVVEHDAQQTVLDTHVQYDAFGGFTGGTEASLDFLFAFTGRPIDRDTGLYDYRARWYDPDVGRFLTEDPAGLDADVNLYRYAGNSPVVYTDPSGMQKFAGVMGAAAAASASGFLGAGSIGAAVGAATTTGVASRVAASGHARSRAGSNHWGPDGFIDIGGGPRLLQMPRTDLEIAIPVRSRAPVLAGGLIGDFGRESSYTGQFRGVSIDALQELSFRSTTRAFQEARLRAQSYEISLSGESAGSSPDAREIRRLRGLVAQFEGLGETELANVARQMIAERLDYHNTMMGRPIGRPGIARGGLDTIAHALRRPKELVRTSIELATGMSREEQIDVLTIVTAEDSMPNSIYSQEWLRNAPNRGIAETIYEYGTDPYTYGTAYGAWRAEEKAARLTYGRLNVPWSRQAPSTTATATSPRYWWTGRYSTPASQPGAYQASSGRVFPTRRNSGLSGPALRSEQQAFAGRRLMEGNPIEVVRGQAREAGLTVFGRNERLADRGAENAIQRAIEALEASGVR